MALLHGADASLLRAEFEKLLDRSMGRLSTSRISRAFKIGKLAAAGGGRLAFDKARRLLSGDRSALISTEAGVKLAAEMMRTFAELRGISMKIGQMLSYVDHNLPPEARRVLALLQRDAPAMPFDEVGRVLRAELGKAPEEVFAEIEAEPIAAASIGQVHRGRLLDGTEVAIKVQYPGIDRAMASDLKNARVASLFKQVLFVNTDIKGIMEEIEQRLLDECDYLREAEYQETFRARFEGHPVIVIPRVHREASSRRVLVTTFEHGRTFYEWLAGGPSPAERERVARTFYRFYLGSFYLDGLFNCDPHPGNYLFRDDGKVVFLDFGCVRPFDEQRRPAWINAAQTVRADDPAGLHQMGLEIGFVREDVEYDRASFRSLMRYLYEPYLDDAPYDFARHQPLKTFRAMFTQNPNLFKLNMPPDAVFLNRITFGVVSLLTEIGAPLNCYRLASSYFQRIDPDWPDDPGLS